MSDGRTDTQVIVDQNEKIIQILECLVGYFERLEQRDRARFSGIPINNRYPVGYEPLPTPETDIEELEPKVAR